MFALIKQILSIQGKSLSRSDLRRKINVFKRAKLIYLMNFGVPGKIFAPELSKTVRNLPEPRGTFRSLSRHFQRNLPELHEVSVPEPAGTSPSIFPLKLAGTSQSLANFRNFTRYLYQNLIEPITKYLHRTLEPYTEYLHPKLPELHEVFTPEPSGTSPEPLRNLTRYLHSEYPCTHFKAFCNIRIQIRISRRTWQHKTTTIMQSLHCDLQPESQETLRTTHTSTTTHCTEYRGGTNPARFERSRTRRTHEVPFIAGRNHFIRKNTKFPAPTFP